MGPTKRGFVLFGVDQMVLCKPREDKLAFHQSVQWITY